MTDYVAYYRVSTQMQGASGLGLEAQRADAQRFIRAGDRMIAEFTEVESGRRCDRPQLTAALSMARQRKAVLLIAKLDRLSRDALFILTLLRGRVPIKICDMPEANELVLTVMAGVAQQEAKAISQRTKAALSAARARGVKLGRPKGTITPTELGVAARQRAADLAAHEIEPHILQLQANGVTSLWGLAQGLNAKDIPTPRGCSWSPAGVRRVLKRLEKKKALRSSRRA